MINARFLRNVLCKGLFLFLIFNLVWALLPLPVGRVSLYNVLWRGRERFPFGEDPAQTYNLSLYDVDAMFASLKLAAAPKPADEFRVFVIGDSAAWGTLLKPAGTLAGQLDALGLKLCGRTVRVYNLGYPTLSLTKDLLILQQAMQYQPDLIVWPLTLESFPRERQLDSPIVANNPERVQALIQQYNLNLTLTTAKSNLFDRTIIGRRRSLADLLRLQLYGAMWSASGIDQLYPADYTPAARDLEASTDFLGWPGQIPTDGLALDVLQAGLQAAGQTPVLLVNEPILISKGQNSDVRYNFYYPRWVYDDYRQVMADEAAAHAWNYLDLWNLVPEDQFTNSAIHLTPSGEAMLAGAVSAQLADQTCTNN